VATNVGGVSELITHGEDGYLEAVGDVEAQAARVVELLSDAALHERMRAAARLTALTRFCSSLVIPQYIRYYQEICSR
jgi:glycosyltransferase involved in cell wall biosynthesis